MLSSILSGRMEFTDVIIYILSALAVIFLTMPVHEFAHGFAAVKLGDNTPRWQGRLTLNPLAHIDYVGALCILLFGFGWARPVQVNQNSFRNPKRDMAITALAGPLSNLVVALLALVLSNVCYLIVLASQLAIVYYISTFLYWVAFINVSLAVFNLIPIPPLDGSRILSAVLPNRTYYTLMRYERYIYIGLLALLWFGVLDVPLDYLTSAVFSGLNKIASLPFGF